MTGESPGQASFRAHVELLQLFLAHREAVVEKIEAVLNAQRKPADYLQNRPLLSRHFEDCFFALSAITEDGSRLRGQLEAAHWASGFRPRQVKGLFNDLISPAEMMLRAFYLWQRIRWPGRNGRVRFAHTLFNLYLIRCLQLLAMRLWDSGTDQAGERLAQTQTLLDQLWSGSGPDQPVLVRDARWLIPLAQSPTTDELAAYFNVAEQVASTLAPEDSVEVQKAHVRMLGGHLTSQIRHYCIQDGVTLDENSVVLRTRTSNALDFALLIQGLVTLLEAYERARQSGDARQRFELAGAICQGISPDPELFLNRVDLLGAYSMIEHLFVATDSDGQVVYSPMGQRHLQFLQEYETLIRLQAKPLYADCQGLRPVEGSYSPYGAIFGTPTNLLEDMTLKSLDRDAVTTFSLEDVFVDGDADPARLAWVDGWRKLPHIDREVQSLYSYPQQFAEDLFDRIERELSRSVSDAGVNETPRTGRLVLVSVKEPEVEPTTEAVPELPSRYVESSDQGIVTAQKAEACDQARLLRNREEGHYVASFETSNGWVAIKKDMLTEVIGAGSDARISGLPAEVAAALTLLCPNIDVTDAVNR